ncbi:MAG TPA: SagB/ThcOx family dehydrogenase [Bryobacteraceae bacterium]|nr:SagB/ThcOx family dehydrogenase [Bryobacteraceae bacterium]HOQ44547.1 SagB/ThcOx family dehydrogenase [Bryobacteraceae bacterium]HPU70866.1 SagB/ThcOx family dehydrogenase [Bryobacteraceae bacterium]
MLRLVVAMLLCAATVPAQDLKPIPLPKPQTEGGKPLMQALKERKSTREFSQQKLSPQVLSNLLWAAFGINREDGRRTAPTASNRQEIDIYVVMEEGAYRYDPKANQLEPVAKGDLRKATGTQDFVAQAPVNLVYVADLAKQKNSDWAYADTGFIAQNVYLYCASEGLATVVRGMVPREPLAKALNLRPDQRITLGQTVGYPGK